MKKLSFYAWFGISKTRRFASMKITYKPLLFIFVAIIVLGFFLSWVNVESKQVGIVSELITGKHQEVIDSISGFDIPVMANSDETRLIISVLKIFQIDTKNIDKKSLLVFVVPLLAIAILFLNLSLKNKKILTLVIAIVATLIFLVATYKIKTTDLDKVVLQVKIGLGLWLILYSYLGIGLLHAIKLIKPKLVK